MPGGDRAAAGLPDLQGGLPPGDGPRARARRARRGSWPGRGVSRSDRPVLAARGDAPAARGDQGGHAARLLGRHRAEQARREGRLRRGEAGRLRRAHARAGVCALCRVPAGAGAGHRAEDRRAPGGAGADDARRRRRRARAGARRALRTEPRPRAGTSRALRTRRHRRRGSQGRIRVARADLRPRRQRPRPAARVAAHDGRRAVREPRSPTSAAGARSGSRSVSTTSRRSRARIRSAHPRATPSW